MTNKEKPISFQGVELDLTPTKAGKVVYMDLEKAKPIFADAERYRWLKNEWQFAYLITHGMSGGPYKNDRVPVDWDTYIDAQIAKEREGK